MNNKTQRQIAGLLVLSFSLVPSLLFANDAETNNSNVERNTKLLLQYEGPENNNRTYKNTLSDTQGITIHQTYEHVLKGAAITAPASELAELLENKRLKRASTDRRISFNNEPVPEHLDRINAQTQENKPEHNKVNIAILDTGIDVDHPALKENIKGGTSVTGSTMNDPTGHGTHVAGIISASGGKKNVNGIAPKANLYPVKVSEEKNGYTSSIIAGLEWVIDHDRHEPIDLVNLSLGSVKLQDNDLLKNAVQHVIEKNITVVVSAGNDQDPVKTHSPARIDGVITVSALGEGTKQFGSFSNYGENVDMTAPGIGIPSTEPGGYGHRSGTSVSAPQVTGAAALLIGQLRKRRKHANGQSTTRIAPRIIEAGLKANGIRRDWSGDPDGMNEPMLYFRNQAQVLGSQLIFGDVGEEKEEDPGGYMGVKPRESVQKSINNAHLRPLTLFVPYVGDIIHIKDTTVQLRVEGGSEKVKLWKTRDKREEISSASWNILEKPDTVYVEGENVSGSAQDVTLSMTVSNKQGTWTDTVKVTVFGIKEVKIGKENRELDQNPKDPGGVRVFPGKPKPEENVKPRDKLTFRAQVTPSVKEVPVKLRIYDVDDPSIDENKRHDNFNLDNERGAPFAAETSTDKNGIAKFKRIISLHPGDNYRIAATVGGFSVLDKAGTSKNDDEKARIVFFPDTKKQMPVKVSSVNGHHIVSSELLTVWRRLHLELDVMETVKNHDISLAKSLMKHAYIQVEKLKDRYNPNDSTEFIPRFGKERSLFSTMDQIRDVNENRFWSIQVYQAWEFSEKGNFSPPVPDANFLLGKEVRDKAMVAVFSNVAENMEGHQVEIDGRTDTAKNEKILRKRTLIHEIGHIFGLGHRFGRVMNVQTLVFDRRERQNFTDAALQDIRKFGLTRDGEAVFQKNIRSN